MLQYFVCTLLLLFLQVLTASQIKDHNNKTYWLMGVALSGCGYNEQSRHRVEPERAVSAAVMDVSAPL